MNSNPSGMGDQDTLSQWMSSFVGLSSVFAAVGLLGQAYLGSSIKLLIMGSIVEAGRRMYQWLSVRLRFQYSISAQFDEGDPAYEWIVLFLTQENVWRRSRDFTVTATNSRRKWSVQTWMDPRINGNAEYVPKYQTPQLFRWRGHWVEIQRSKDGETRRSPFGFFPAVTSIYVTIYTLDMKQLSALVEDARSRYVEVNKPNVVIHLADSPQYGPSMVWTNVKRKVRRPLNSVILQDGVVDTLVRDAQDFLATEDWYVEAGIPHRRGYLLHGPPGTGKTSTIFALAGALNLEIYSLSLASSFVDDSFLQRAASSIPRHALFLIEDIDCAFPASRDDEEEEYMQRLLSGASTHGMDGSKKSNVGEPKVTLSGLLNVIDGVGSEEGKLFFATTNYIDRLDPALLRPGRIDTKIPYELSTVQQARALFMRFFPESRFPEFVESSSAAPFLVPVDEATPEPKPNQTLAELADAFAAAIPTGEFSTAELQSYLQSHKTDPAAATAGASAWVQDIRDERRAREEREEERRRKLRARREAIGGEVGGRSTETVQRTEKAGGKEKEQRKTVAEAVQTETEGEDSPKQGSGSETASEFSSYADGALPAEEATRAIE
ncbi:P-loop containing nucleoside triphosphate hydrolase protein [Mycena albidolilacea]|uniref:P-loop containing nucleoside triphosphate hydrolase protein n=1 Tax=Mycena albidolilacea TaxID=1033008 RepID=A0AAD6Z0G5_9AGAR|nr:P-loop containing nucleoside triphosphate hydrolase protein [Mycena albidolilacea]